MESLKLSAASLHWLADRGHVVASPASPLRALLAGPRRSAEGRRASAERELKAKGITFDAESTSPEANGFKQALQVLAQPEALLRMSALVPSQPVIDFGTVVRGRRACHFAVHRGGLEVTPAAPLDTVAEDIARELTYDGPLARQEVLFWSDASKRLSFLWQESQDPTQGLACEDVLARLAGAGSAEDPERTLDELLQTGFLEVKGDELRIPEKLQPWLGLAWSGYGFQVEYVPLEGLASLDEALDVTGDLLVFVGPPGQRVLNLAGAGQELAGPPTAQDSVRLCAPPAETLRQALRILLRLETTRAATDDSPIGSRLRGGERRKGEREPEGSYSFSMMASSRTPGRFVATP